MHLTLVKNRRATFAVDGFAHFDVMSDPPITLFCFAVKEEAKFFKPLVLARSDIRILLTGMGSNNAQRALRATFANYLPTRVISAGLAGGLKPGLSTGTVLFDIKGDNIALHTALIAAGALPARFHFADHVATLSSEKQRLRETTGADAVEMESQAISQICAERKVASLTVRVVLDPVQEDLPLDFNQLMTSDLRLDSAKLAISLLKDPLKVLELLRLRKQTNLAAKRLAQVLAQVFLKDG